MFVYEESLSFTQGETQNPGTLSPLALAFVGDAVFTLLVKTRLVQKTTAPVGKMHRASAQQVSAAAQAEAFRLLEPLLSEQEIAIFRRGRNAHTGSLPKNMSSAQYHYATGLEALFGWLYLSGNMTRILELFHKIQSEGKHETVRNTLPDDEK